MRLLVYVSILLPTVALLTGCGQSAPTAAPAPPPTAAAAIPATPPAEKLTWAPPPLVDPIDLTITDDVNFDVHHAGGRNLQLRQDRDYVLHIPKPITNGGISVWGGHNVVLIGGEIDYKNPNARHETHGEEGDALYIQATTGTFHVEGLRITGDDHLLADGIDIGENVPGAVVQIENVRIGPCYGGFHDIHNDCVQSWAGPTTLRIDRLTGWSNYQGFFLLPFQHSSPTLTVSVFDFRHVNMCCGGYALWQENPPVPMRIDQVWIKPQVANRWPNLTLWPPGSADTLWKGVRNGDPPGGDFVPAGVAGCDYHSPGYLGDFVPPQPTPTTRRYMKLDK